MPRREPLSNPHWLLRRADQAAVGGPLLFAIGAMTLWWLSQGGWQGRLVEFENLNARTARFEVDINQADWPELSQLPGVGESLARRIVESRQLDGPYADHEELRRVRGIGPRTLERIRPLLRPMPETANVAGP